MHFMGDILYGQMTKWQRQEAWHVSCQTVIDTGH